jgi:hypothetical protein
MLLQIALAAETHLAEELTLKLRCTVNVEESLTVLNGYVQTGSIQNG